MSNAQVFGAKAGFSAHVVSCRAVITTLPLYFKRAPCLPFPTFNNSQNQLWCDVNVAEFEVSWLSAPCHLFVISLAWSIFVLWYRVQCHAYHESSFSKLE